MRRKTLTLVVRHDPALLAAAAALAPDKGQAEVVALATVNEVFSAGQATAHGAASARSAPADREPSPFEVPIDPTVIPALRPR